MRVPLITFALSTLVLAHNGQGGGGSSPSSSPSSTLSSVSVLPVPSGTPDTGDGSLAGVVTVLRSKNFGALSDLIESNAQSVEGLLQSSGGNQTLFAPTDEAFNNLRSTNLSATPWSSLNLTDPATLLNVLSYHLAEGINASELTNDNATILSTRLTNLTLVQLPNGVPQVLVIYGPRQSAGKSRRWGKGSGGGGHSDGSQGGGGSSGQQRVIVSQLSGNFTTGSPIVSGNLTIYPIDRVLLPPPSLYSLLNSPPSTEYSSPNLNLSTFATALPSELQSLVNATGITVFVPTRDALRSALQTFAAQGGPGGQLGRQEAVNVFGNHFVNGSVLYSTNLSSIAAESSSSANSTEGGAPSLTSASGEPLTVSSNGTGTYITSGNATARIVRADVTLSNGVLHIIDRVLFNTAGNLTTEEGAGATAAPSYTVTATSTTSAEGTTLVSGGAGQGGSTTIETATPTSAPTSSSSSGTSTSTQSSSQSTSASSSVSSSASSSISASASDTSSISATDPVTTVVVTATPSVSARVRMVKREKGRWIGA